MGKPYTPWEDRRITEGRAKGLLYSDIAVHIPSRDTISVKTRARKLGIANPKERGGARQCQPTKHPTKRRRCLIGDHMFDARLNENGRLLEFSCRQCRNTAAYSGSAMI